MDSRERDLYARLVLELSKFSESKNPRSAIIVGGNCIFGLSFSKIISPKNTSLDSSPILEAIAVFYKTHSTPGEYFLISTYFPSYSEFEMLSYTPIRKVYYMGDVNDEKAVLFINAHTKLIGEGFEIINLTF